MDPDDRQSRSVLVSHVGRLGDAVWQSDPERALALYDRAFSTAKGLASNEQLKTFEDTYVVSVSRPLMKLGRLAEARKALVELLRSAESDTT